MLVIWVGSMVATSGCCRSRTTWVMPPPQIATCSRLVSSMTLAGSKRPSGHTVVAPVITVDTAIDIPDTWNNGYGREPHRRWTGRRRGEARHRHAPRPR